MAAVLIVAVPAAWSVWGTEPEEPESEFLLRLDKDEGVGLFEADGGMWKLWARKTVKAFLEERLAEEVSAGTVIVAL